LAAPAAPAARGAGRVSYHLSGAGAARFALSSDLTLVKRLRLAHGLAYERYQQRLGPAAVLGGQVTLLKDSSGRVLAVVGARYASIPRRNLVRLSASGAGAAADRDLGWSGERRSVLLLDPASGRYFYQVETRRRHERWFHWVDAADGSILKKYDGRQTDHGIGVKGDTKSLAGLDGLDGTSDDITTFHNAAGHGQPGPHWDLFSSDGRQKTFDARNGILSVFAATDTDDDWTLVTADRSSPGQPAMVDAQYYAQVADGYLRNTHGLDWIADCGHPTMQSVVHYDADYVNAFWDGTSVVYGDGDGFLAREFSGALDVVAHETTHGVTECTSGLLYQDESGALNESFSDMMGTAAEFYAAAHGLDPAAPPDWTIGEDIYLLSSSGFRNMADPAENFDPDHYSERQVGGDDNGGVHTNSSIPNHAFYLLVNGGRNAGEAEGHPHSGPQVAGIGLSAAERIFFPAFTGLAEDATMCDARAATEAVAAALFGADSQEQLSTTDAWLAVGLTDVVCLGLPPEAPTALTATALSSSRISLAWTDNSSSEDGFKLERSSDGVSFSEIATLDVNETSDTDTGLAANGTYSYRVRAFAGAQFSDYSNVAQATTGPPPAAPTSLTAAAVSSGRINLAWVDNASNEAGFKVERSTDGVTFMEIATPGPNTRSYSDTSLAGTTTYHYRVRAYDGPNVSAYSNVASATTLAPPTAPTGLTASAVSSSRINLAWLDNATTETGYKVESSADGVTFAPLASLGANATSYASTNRTALTTYYFRVGATDGANTSYSAVVPATTLPAPAAPSGLAATVVSSSRLSLSWTDNASYEQGYKIERSADGVSYLQVAQLGANATTFADTLLTAGTTYHYRVRAYDGPNNSAYSNDVGPTTLQPPAAPSGLTATSVSPSRIDLAWVDNSTYEQGFRLERSTDGINFAQLTSPGANATSYSNTSLAAGTLYYYRLRAYDGPNNSAYSNLASATTQAPPLAPSGLTATPVSSSRVNLAWVDNSTNESGYQIERSTDGVSFAQIAQVGVNVTSYASTLLSAGTLYSYRVRAYEGTVNHSDYSDVATATTLAPPPAPSSLAATTISPSRIDLAWTDNSTYEQGFQLERSTDGVNFVLLVSPAANATSYSNTSLTAGLTYYYRLRAYDGPNNSAYSNVASATTQAPPLAPSGLTATPVSSSRVNLAWLDNATNETGYKVERSSDGVSFTQISQLGANVTSYASTSLDAGSTFYYRVRAYEGTVNNSEYSNVATATTLAPPAAPSSLAATVVSPSRIDLAWTDNSGYEQGFRVERSTDGVNFVLLASPAANATSYSNTSLTAGTTYYYRVRAYDGSNNSAYSDVASATTQSLAAPTGLVATPFSSSRIDLTWVDNATNEAGYKVERSTDGVTFTQITQLGANVTSYASTSLAAGSTFYYRVKAYEGTANGSDYSNVATATTLATPAAPSNLAATVLSPSRIDLAWTDNSAYEQGFQLERSTDGVNFVLLASRPANGTSYSNTSLTAGTTYYYRVRAYDGPNNSAYSDVAAATAQSLATPTGLVATPFSSSRIDLTWVDNATNEAGYKVERSADGVTFTQITQLGAGATSYSNTSLAAGTSLYYRVRAFEGANNSDYSTVATAATLAAPAAPSGLTATAAPGRIDLSWADNSSYEQGFRVERSLDGAAFTQIAQLAANVTTYANTSLASGTRYYYRVRAFDGSNVGAYSNVASAMTP
jgi:Zn-dependent metalloprotease